MYVVERGRWRLPFPLSGHRPRGHRALALFVVACVTMIALAAPISAGGPASRDRSVDGVVRDQTGLVVPGASVTLLPIRAQATTDAEGRFRFEGLEAGHYRVKCELAGFGAAESHTIDLTSEKTARVDLILSASFTENVVVTATRTRVELAEVPVRTDVIPSRAIELSVPHTLADALVFTPGVRVETDCHTCNFSQVRLLGLDGAYTQILIDGQPVVGSLAQVYGVEQIPARLVERVEIVKGGGSALYGSGAVGGVVNVIPREPSTTGGSAMTHADVVHGVPRYSAGGVADWVAPSRRVLVTAFGQVDGSRAIDLTGDGFSELGRRRMQAGGGRLASYWLGGRGKLTVDGYYMHEYRRGGDNIDRPEPESLVAGRVNSHGINANVSWLHSCSPRLDYRVTLSTSHTRRDTYYGAGRDPNAFGDSSSLVTAIDTQMNHYLPKRVLSWGVQGSTEHLIDTQPAYNRSIDDTYRSVGVFVQDAWAPRQGWQLLTGLRIDRPNTLDSPGVSPRVALMWTPRPNLTARASVATGFRAPQVFDEDLHISSVNGVSYLITNEPGLARESSLSLSSGIEWKPVVFGGTGLVGVTLFHTRLDNVFAVQEADDPATPSFEFRRVNADGGRVYGAEINLGWGLGDHFVAQVGLVEQRAEYDNPEPDFGSRRFFRTPERSLIGLLTWKTDVGDLFVALRYTGPMYAPHYAGYVPTDRLERTDAFLECDASYARRLATGRPVVKLVITAKNLTNAYQRDIDQGPLRDSGYVYGPRTPRALGVGLLWEF